MIVFDAAFGGEQCVDIARPTAPAKARNDQCVFPFKWRLQSNMC